MKLFSVKILSLFFFLFKIVVVTNCQDEEGEMEEAPKTCSQWLFDLVSIVLEGALPCLTGGWKINGIHEVVTRVFCLVKCVLTGVGLLGEDGKLEQVAAAVFFGDNFPAELRNIIIPAAEPCFALADLFNGDEYSCRSYADFTQCAATVVTKALIPYAIDCFGSPLISIGLSAVFGSLKLFAPQSPNIVKEEMTRYYETKSLALPPKCFDPPACDKHFKYMKVNGSSAIVWYDRNMTEVGIEYKKSKERKRLL